MKLIRQPIFITFLFAFLLAGCGPTGCNKTTLSKDGVYQGDKLLYSAEKATTTAYKEFDRFLRWEERHRTVLHVEVSRTADTIRKNSKNWIDSAIALRDAYVASPTPENKNKLQLSLDLIATALDEAAKYESQNKSIAPPISIELPVKK